MDLSSIYRKTLRESWQSYEYLIKLSSVLMLLEPQCCSIIVHYFKVSLSIKLKYICFNHSNLILKWRDWKWSGNGVYSLVAILIDERWVLNRIRSSSLWEEHNPKSGSNGSSGKVSRKSGQNSSSISVASRNSSPNGLDDYINTLNLFSALPEWVL